MNLEISLGRLASYLFTIHLSVLLGYRFAGTLNDPYGDLLDAYFWYPRTTMLTLLWFASALATMVFVLYPQPHTIPKNKPGRKPPT